MIRFKLVRKSKAVDRSRALEREDPIHAPDGHVDFAKERFLDRNVPEYSTYSAAVRRWM
jgi:hypothetical protein